ncbi:glycosyltransferase family 4 protein [Vulcanisaeta souniana]|uniref:Glycosyltransferase family 1 protein n=1 Tax=Vulcanisaeta souniana JCM 11219 TaxID=1293586 RepID=A0A830E5C4_9CREN|nr:glycosyltransferase family 1 protein [Vulcanisaeta souniana]BDR92705.1 hypothetical protein Vsou_17980 [Vulcanisaeta souniana JCM 11219]GGI84282.1 hypothetical protein GCM10007112_21520 [Vulcanisaeta souniana JCM 11219]
MVINVLIVADHYDMQRKNPSGIYYYIFNLIKGLKKFKNIKIYTLRLMNNDELGHKDYVFTTYSYSPLSLLLRNIRLGLDSQFMELLRNIDIVHLPVWGFSYIPFVLLKQLFKFKLIVTIHDIGNIILPYLYAYGYMERIGLLLSLRYLNKYVDSIIAISKSTKYDLMNIANIPEAKIQVIYNGIDEIFRPINKNYAKSYVYSKYGIDHDCIIYVGTAHPRKNLARLLLAYFIAVLRGLNHDLVLVGTVKNQLNELLNNALLNSEKLKQYKDLILSKIKAIGYVPREDLPYLYSACDISVFLSLYEGFGFPVAEAMACGTPVIASNISSMPEIVGDAGILVNPYDIEEITQAILKLANDIDLRQELSKRAFKRSLHFKWDITAKRTAELYYKLLAS